ncbi:MAG: Alpha/beta hydrolase fold-3 domain [Geobacteraceae bacterium]|nr:MAG: Alpha/beta hydrolase fold-3 domain [Geobacteraceae bacterium]
MPSLQCRIFLFVLRNRHLLRFKLKKETAVDWETSLPEVRRSAEKSAKMLGKLPKDIEASPVAIGGGLLAEWIQPAQAVKDKVILYFHGGGYVLGSIQAHRGIVSKFVKGSGVVALLFDYRLAPEHPFPAALDDSLAAYRWLLAEGVSPSKIVFAGDSAGGGLCLATLLALRDQGIPLPAAAVTLSPWTDVKNTGESLRTNARLCLAPANSWVACSKHYAGNNDPGLPYISPLYGDLRGLPPILIHVGGHETLLSDSTRFAEKAKAAGTDVTLKIGEGLFHCYPACAPLFPEATQAMDEICAFIKTHVGK